MENQKIKIRKYQCGNCWYNWIYGLDFKIYKRCPKCNSTKIKTIKRINYINNKTQGMNKNA